MSKKYFPFAVSVQGESHKKREALEENVALGWKFPCQDRSCSTTLEPESEIVKKGEFPVHVSCVCDGHGGAAYFRSDIGAEFAICAMLNAIEDQYDMFFCCADGDAKMEKFLHENLIPAIVENWQDAVDAHLEEFPITDEEWTFLEGEDEEAFNAYKSGEDLRSIYGCTALCVAVAEFGWFAVQIGDGDIVVEENGKLTKPVPNDEKIFLNVTTSLCEDDAEKEFRIAYGPGKPNAVLCSSDGLANCFKDDEGLFGFEEKLLWLFREWQPETPRNEHSEVSSGEESVIPSDEPVIPSEVEESPNITVDERAKLAVGEIEESLPDFSKRGSGDDISLAGYVCVEEVDDEM